MIEAEVRALVFTALVLTILSLIIANRAFGASLRSAILRPNRALGWVMVGVAAMLGVVLYWPFAADLFSFAPLTLPDLALAVGAGCGVLLCLEGLKIMRLRFMVPPV